MAKRILVIDDEAVIRQSFSLALENTGYRLDTAESGEKGLSLLRGSDYDLIFLDLKMPGMSGVETLKVIRQVNRNVPIYIVTAFYGDYFEELREMADQGIDFEVLQKPLEMEQIVMIVKGVLDGPVLDNSSVGS